MSENARDRVSVIIPARNEEANIERCVCSIADQRGVRIREIIVVDDQSTDRTPAILEGLKATTPFLRVLRTESLPSGWLGKSYALATGAQTASGDWLLFTDADTEHLPGSLAESLARAEHEHIDLLSLSPGQLTPTWWEKALIPLVYVWLSKTYQFDAVNDPASKSAAANGQYMLIRREVYERIGGHTAVKDAILEDVALAERVKLSGARLLFLPGAEWVHTRMYRTFSEMWRGWTKNLYLLYGGSVRLVFGTLATTLLVDWVPVVCLVSLGFFGRLLELAPTVWVLYSALLASIFVLQHHFYRRRLLMLGFDPGLAFYYHVGSALFSVLLLNSLRAHRWRGNVEWKGREYSTRGAFTR